MSAYFCWVCKKRFENSTSDKALVDMMLHCIDKHMEFDKKSKEIIKKRFS